jgi:hypothetical protein
VCERESVRERERDIVMSTRMEANAPSNLNELLNVCWPQKRKKEKKSF